MNFLNKKWYRNLFSHRTFVKADGNWIDIKNYTKGKITDVDGKWNIQAFCDCGNELIHSKSFLQERDLKIHSVFDYKCSNCGEVQYWNPDVIPGLLKCDINGTPLYRRKLYIGQSLAITVKYKNSSGFLCTYLSVKY